MRIYFTVFLLTLFLLAGCSKSTINEQEYLVKAQTSLNSGSVRTAVIHVKNVLQQNAKNSEARYLLGKIYSQIGKGEDAEIELRRAIEFGYEREKVEPYLGEALFLQGKFSDVLQTLKDDGGKADLLVLKGNAYIGLAEYISAKEQFTNVLSKDEKNAGALLGKAKLALVEKDILVAEKYLEQALDIEETLVEAWQLKGGLLFTKGELDAAELAFAKVVSLEPDVPTNSSLLAHASLARVYIAKEDFQAALTHVDRILMMAPNHPGANYLRALVAYGEKEFDTAESHLHSVKKFLPDDLGVTLLLGTVNYHQQKYEQANINLSHFVSKQPTFIPARKILAATRIQLNRPKEAMDVLEPAMSAAPQDSEFYKIIGSVAMRLGDRQGAKEYLSKALKEKPGDFVARSQLTSLRISEGEGNNVISELEAAILKEDASYKDKILLIQSYIQKNDIKKAKKLAMQVIKEHPGESGAYSLLAHIALHQGEAELARGYYEDALEINPNSTELAIHAARLNVQLGEYFPARESLEALLDKHPDNISVMVELVKLEKQAKRLDDAIKWSKKIQNYKSTWIGYELEGKLRAIQGDYASAAKNFEIVLANSPTEEMAILKFKAQKEVIKADAISFLEKWVESNSDHTDAKIALATQYLVDGESTRAIPKYEQALDSQPNNPIVLNNLAWLYLERGDSTALSLAGKAYKNIPNNPAILDTYGWALVNFGKVEKGVELLEKAFKLVPNDDMILLHLQAGREKLNDLSGGKE